MMNWFNNPVKDAVSGLLGRCADWLRRFGRFRPFKKVVGEIETPSGDEKYRWVWDPERQVWMMELVFAYRSLEVRLRAGEAELPSGVRSLRRILGSGS